MPTYTTPATKDKYQLILNVERTAQNTAKTTSTLKLTLYVQPNGNRAFTAGVTGYVKDKKNKDTSWTTRKTFSNESKKVPYKTKTKIWEGTYTYNHASDKTLKVNFEIALKTTTQGKSWSMPNTILKCVYGGSTTAGTTSNKAAATARGIYVYKDKKWKAADLYVMSGGKWKRAEPYVMQNGEWEKVGG